MSTEESSINKEIVQNKIRIVIADDHPMLRQAIRTAMQDENDLEIIGEAEDGEAAVKLALELNPDIVIMDIGMPVLNGLEATRQIKSKNADIKVLVFTVYDDSEHIIGIFEAGADGYLTKRILGRELIQAIRAQAGGETVLTSQIFKQLFKYAARHSTKPVTVNSNDSLTVREMEILTLMAKGKTNKDIANELKLSVRTVKSHLIDIFNKLKVNTRTEAVITALRSNIISLSDLD